MSVPCSGPAAHTRLVFSRGASSVATSTDGAGRYRVSLATGRWSVRASRGMRISPATVLVGTSPARVRFAIDTGIR